MNKPSKQNDDRTNSIKHNDVRNNSFKLNDNKLESQLK